MGTIVATVQQSHVSSFLGSLPPSSAAQSEHVQGQLAQLQAGDQSVLGRLPAAVVDAAHDALTAGVSSAYYVAGGALIAGAVLVGLLLRHVRATDGPTRDQLSAIAG